MSVTNQLYEMDMSALKSASNDQQYARGILDTPVIDSPVIESPQPQTVRFEGAVKAESGASVNVNSEENSENKWMSQINYSTDIGQATKIVTDAALDYLAKKTNNEAFSKISYTTSASDAAATLSQIGMEKLSTKLNSSKVSEGVTATKKVRAMKRVK